MRIMFDTYLKVGNYYLGKKIMNIGGGGDETSEPENVKTPHKTEKPAIRNPYTLYIKNVPFTEFTDEEIKEGYNKFYPHLYDTGNNVYEQEYKRRFG